MSLDTANRMALRWRTNSLSLTRKSREVSTMSRAKPTAKRKRLSKAVPMAGIAGVSLAMAGSASALTVPTANVPSQSTAPNHEITLGDEELSDVSLGTFYVFGNENAAPVRGVQEARRGCGGCRGCRGCGRGCGGCHRGCGGCHGCWGGCGCGCCLSWGGCRLC